MAVISPEALYPEGGETPSFQLLDVRAPAEFERGAMPFSVNEPILTGTERHQVGLRYQASGPEAAIELGYALTEAEMPGRIARWRQLCEQGPTAVTCWRGGLRSKLACEFIGSPEVARVAGGYKALRAHVMTRLGERVPRLETLVIAGLTGSGKTALLHAIAAHRRDLLALDLEAEANHRGSAFGQRAEAQPSQQTFENSLAVKLLLSPHRLLLLEDESRHVGCRQVPDPLYLAIRRARVLFIEESFEHRVARIHRDYVLELSRALGAERATGYFKASLERLKKRLSGEAFATCRQALSAAERSDDWPSLRVHEPWIRTLLEAYYDPRYRKGLEADERPMLFRGTYEECMAWMNQRPHPFA